MTINLGARGIFAAVFTVGAILGLNDRADARECHDVSTAAAAAGVGKAVLVRHGSGGEIILMEETHDSYRSNIEEAIFLLRLGQACARNDIGLEGYTKQDKPFFRFGPPNPAVALSMLRDGVISAAEFMYLGFDAHVHPIEDGADRVDIHDTHEEAPPHILTKLLEANIIGRIRKGEISKEDLLEAKGDVSRTLSLVNDPFLLSFKNKLIDNEAKFSGSQEEIEMNEKLLRLAESAGAIAGIAETDLASMRMALTYLKKRQHASVTMANSIIAAINGLRANDRFASIIGSAHTKNMVSLLSRSGRPLLVFTPQVTGSDDELFADAEMAAKFDRNTSRQDAWGSILRSVLPAQSTNQQMKPPVSITSPSVSTEFEFLDKMDQLTSLAFGNGGDKIPPTRPPIPSAEFPEDHGLWKALLSKVPPDVLKGQFFKIDRDQIKMDRDERGFAALILPVQFGDESKNKSQLLWVKLAKSDIALGIKSGLNVEQELVQTASGSRHPAPPPNDVKIEEISPGTSMALGIDEEKVKKTKLNRT